jgi:predicted O-linked N-acetylglucosamine transferase (SPINDLY family)
MAGASPAKPSFAASLPLQRGPLQPLQLPEVRRDQRLRIGFLSAEIGSHVVASFLFSFLDHYDRDRFAVELFAASRRFDARASEMAELADHHWLLDGMDQGRARDLIRSRKLDIVVETSGFTADSAIDLLAERCAPVQCHYIGYHATTGLDTMDWFIGDAETVPEAFSPQFVEGLWRLPRLWLARRPEPTLPPAFSESRDPVAVLGSFNQLAKVREETLRYWAAALHAVPSSRLVLKDRSVADAQSCERIVKTLTGLGVDAGRISFLGHVGSWEEHMATYNQLDVALDTTPWSSATTGFDALAMGVPLVAIRGGCTAARMSASIVKGLGKPEWISETPDQFAAIVAGLCVDLPDLRASKQELRSRVLASPLFNGVELSRDLEHAFLAMQKGSAPDG